MFHEGAERCQLSVTHHAVTGRYLTVTRFNFHYTHDSPYINPKLPLFGSFGPLRPGGNAGHQAAHSLLLLALGAGPAPGGPVAGALNSEKSYSVKNTKYIGTSIVQYDLGHYLGLYISSQDGWKLWRRSRGC